MFSIKNVLISGIVGLQAVTVSAILVSSYLSSEEGLLGHARRHMDRVSAETAEHAERFLLPAQSAADLTQRLARHDVLQTSSFPEMQRYFYEQLRLHKTFSGIYFGAIDGGFAFVMRDDSLQKGGYFTKSIDARYGGRSVRMSWRDAEFRELDGMAEPDDVYDPRNRPWYVKALAEQRQIWTEPYIFFTSKNPGVSVAAPVHAFAGDLVGVVGVDIEIGALSAFLAALDISPNALAFVLNHNLDVIALPAIDKIRAPAGDGEDGLRFTRIEDLDEPVARAAFESLALDGDDLVLGEPLRSSFSLEDKDYLASFSPILGRYLPWTLGIVVPQDDFLGSLKANRRHNILVAVAITVAACLIGLLLWRSIARPMAALSRHAGKVQQGDFATEPAIESAYGEIRETVSSFRHMVAGLRARDERNRELAEELLESEARLHQSQKLEAVGQLTGGLAHDFNNMLAVIVGCLDDLDRKLADRPAERPVVATALRACERAADLTHRLLAVSRRQHLKPRVVDLNAAIAGMAELLHRTLGETVTVRTRIAADLSTARLDPAQLEVSLLNLATNARHAMPAGGTLTIETSNVTLSAEEAAAWDGLEPGRHVAVTVSDDGVGIPPEALDHIFEPFFTTRPVGKGSGLGLSMVHGFVRQSRGGIAVESRRGTGTTFRILFPAVADGAAPAETPGTGDAEDPPPIPRAADRRIRVLLVEDDAEVRAVTAHTLADLGYDVAEAGDGTAALELLETAGPVDILFTDIVLPKGMDGFALAREARRRRPGLPLLFASGYDAEAGLRAEGPPEDAEVIQKPYRRLQLDELLQAALAAPAGRPGLGPDRA